MIRMRNNWIDCLILLLMICGLSLASLPVREALAGEQAGARSSLSPAHSALLKVLRTQAAARGKATALGAQAQRINNLRSPAGSTDSRATAAQEKTRQPSQPARVYLAPDDAQRRLLLEGLARELRTRRVAPEGEGALILHELERLSGLTRQAGPSLAADEFAPGEPNRSEIEPNDTWEQAQPIEYGNLVASASTPQKDIDVFSFQGRAGDFVRIEALPVSNDNGWTVTRLFDADTNLISGGYYGIKDYESSDSRLISPIIWPGGNIIGASLTRDGTFYIEVTSYPGGIIFLDTGAGAEGAEDSEETITYTLSLLSLPTRPVNGTVIDDRGGVVAGAELYVWSYDGIGGVQATSGKDGAFSFKLPEGSYSVSIKSPPYSRYPDDQVAESFRVGEKGAELQFTLKSGVIFSGVTLDDRGEIAPGTGFSLIDYENGRYRWGYSDEQGNFSVAVFPGTYDIYLSASYRYPPQPVIRGVKIEADTEYKIVLDTGNRVSGAVLAPDGHPLGGVSLTFYGEQDARWAYSDAGGRYEVALLDGNYRIEIYMWGAYLLPDQVVGPLAVTGDLEYDIRLAAGGIVTGAVLDSRGNPVAGAQINLWPAYQPDYSDGADSDTGKPGVVVGDDTAAGDSAAAGNSAEGRVSGGSGTADGAVDSRLLPYYYYQAVTRWTDEKGNWEVALMPGEYTVEVIAPYDYPPQQTKAGTWKIAEGDRLAIPTVTLEHGVTFSGRLLRPDGSVQPYGAFMMQSAVIETLDTLYVSPDGATREFAPDDYPWLSRWVYTDENGAFSLRVFPGVYDLYFEGRFEKGGYPSQKMAGITIERDQDLTLTLQAGQRLSGKALDPEGRGLEGSYLSFFGEDGSWQGGVSSGRDGTFELQLMAGRYAVLVSPAGEYFPDSSKFLLEVTGDQTLEVLFRPGVRVYGRVSDSNGRGLSGAMLHLVPHYTDQDTTISILPVDPLLRTLSAGAGLAGAVGLVEEDLPDPVRADESELVATRSKEAGFAPDFYEGSMPSYKTDYYGGRYYPLPWWGDYDFYAWTAENGGWSVTVKAGVYDIYVEPNTKEYAGAFLPAVECSKELELNFTLALAEVAVNGTVEDKEGQPVPGALISLLDTRTGGHVTALTDMSGNFRLNAAPGEYELYAGGEDNANGAPVTAKVSLSVDRELKIRLGAGVLNGDSGPGTGLPRAFSLGQNTPNPFNPSTTISYSVSSPAWVRLAVYDLRGRLVATLADKTVEAGTYYVQWDGSDSRGRTLASGVYFYRLESADFSETRKMVLLK